MKRCILVIFAAAASTFADYEWVMPISYPNISIGGGQWASISAEFYFLERLIGISVGGGYTEGFNTKANGGYDRTIVVSSGMLLYLGDKNGFRLGIGVKGIFPVWSFSGYISGRMSGGMMPPLLTARFEYPFGQFSPFLEVMYFPGQSSKYYWESSPTSTFMQNSDSSFAPWGIGLSFGVKWHWPK